MAEFGGEERLEVSFGDGLLGDRVEVWGAGLGEVSVEVVPLGGHLGFVQDDFSIRGKFDSHT